MAPYMTSSAPPLAGSAADGLPPVAADATARCLSSYDYYGTL